MRLTWILLLLLAAAAAAGLAVLLMRKRKPAAPATLGDKITQMIRAARKGKIPEGECKCPSGYYYQDTNSAVDSVFQHCQRRRKVGAGTVTDATLCNPPQWWIDHEAANPMPGLVLPKSEW